MPPLDSAHWLDDELVQADGRTSVPVLYDRCRAALAECRTTDEVRHIRDRAKAIAAYAQQAKDRTLEADAYEIRFRAERRLGQMLLEHKAAIGFANGGDAQRTRFRPGTVT